MNYRLVQSVEQNIYVESMLVFSALLMISHNPDVFIEWMTCHRSSVGETRDCSQCTMWELLLMLPEAN